MQTPTNVSLVLTDVSSLKGLADPKAAISYGGFYQLIASRLIAGVYKEQFFREFGDRLVTLAEHAHAFRRMDLVESVSQSLVNLRLSRSYQAVGRYYQAWCVHKCGRGNSDEAARLLDRVATEAPPLYRLRALQSLAGNSFHKGDYRSALALYREAGHFASLSDIKSPYAAVATPKMIAVISAEEGNHTGAVALLENLFPLAHSMRSAQPHVYYDYVNGLAVELCEVGRIEEARNISQIVLASPLAGAYPEWRETREEIELRGYRASRSAVAFHQAIHDGACSPAAAEPGKLMRLPLPEHAETRAADSASGNEPARVLSLHEWKTKMVKQSNGDPQDQTPKPTTSKEKQAMIKKLGKMTTREKLLRIMKVIGDERVGDDLLLRALIVLEELETDENSAG